MYRSIFCFLAAVTILLGGCAPTGGSYSSSNENILIYARGSDPDTLDPMHTHVGEAIKVLVNVCETLVTFDDKTLEIVPCLAESWSVSEDAKVWTFTLRKDVKFHDGTTLDADDVVFTFDRMLVDDNPHVHFGIPPYRPHYTSIEKVVAVDPLTVEFHLKAPNAVFLQNLTMFPTSIVSPEAVKKSGKNFANHPVGTGPFRMKRWDRTERVILEANPDYWNGRPKLDGIVFIRVPENSVRIEQLRRGEVHITDNLPSSELDELAKNEDIVIQEQEGLNICYLSMQTTKKPLDNPKLRQAIWHAIDKKRLIEYAYAGKATAALSVVPPNMWGHNTDLQDRKFDPDKARQLLEEVAAESGLTLPVSLKLFVMNGPRPYVQQPREVAVFIKDSLAEIGIQTEIITDDVRQYFQRLSRGEHELAISGWFADCADPDNMMYSLLHSSNISDAGGNNTSRYQNPTVDGILEEAVGEVDLGSKGPEMAQSEKRKQMYFEAQRLMFEDAPIVPLVHTTARIAQRKELKGYYLHPSSLVRLRLAHFEDQP